MLLLFESPAGYAIFKVLDETKLLQESDDLYKDFSSPESAAQIVKLKHFEKFNDTTEALAASTAAIEGKIPKVLKKVIKKHLEKDTNEKILVLDAKLGAAIKEKFNVPCLYDTPVKELIRCVRSQLDSLMSGMQQKENTAMTLGLAHALSTYKLKFSPDKIDIMIVHAVCLLDDLDKELNNYIMRCREWYGWHFPELSTIITDNLAYVKTIKVIGTRENTAQADLSDILPEEVEERVKEAAEISMGTEITEVDIKHIFNLCEQIVELSRYRTELYDYLKARMMALAPNFTVLVGDMVGARLISHAGSLINLAKYPASTVQILGSEKALFRALKTKKDTPKYGLIYHAQLVGQSSARNKGKMSRMLAAKAALAIRVDALGDEKTTVTLGIEHKAKLEARLRQLEQGNEKRLSGTAKAKAKLQKYYQTGEGKPYPEAGDSTLPTMSPKTPKKPKIEEVESSVPVKIEEVVEDESTGEHSTKKKKKKNKPQPNDVEENGEERIKKGKKRHQEDPPADLGIKEEDQAESPPKKKKKKSKKPEETA